MVWTTMVVQDYATKVLYVIGYIYKYYNLYVHAICSLDEDTTIEVQSAHIR